MKIRGLSLSSVYCTKIRSNLQYNTVKMTEMTVLGCNLEYSKIL